MMLFASCFASNLFGEQQDLKIKRNSTHGEFTVIVTSNGEIDDDITISVTPDKLYTFEFNGDIPFASEYSQGSLELKLSLGDEDSEDGEEGEGETQSCDEYVIEVNGDEKGTSTSIRGEWTYNNHWTPTTYEVRVVKKSDSDENDPGNDSPDAGGCGTCPSGVGARMMSVLNKNTLLTSPPSMEPWVRNRFGLGRTLSGKSVGGLYFAKALDNFSAPSKSDFTIEEPLPASQVIRVSGELRQILTPECLVNFVDIVGGVTLEFYKISDVGGLVGGVYTTNSGPFVTYSFETGNDLALGDGLIYTKTIGAHSVSQEYYGMSTVDGYLYKHITPTGEITDEIGTLTMDLIDPNAWTRIVEKETKINDGTNDIIIASTRKEYASREWGEVLEVEIIDPNGEALTTQYAYYDDSLLDGPSYTKRKHIIYPAGNWEKYTYDSSGRRQKIYKPWKDLPAHPDNASDLNSRYTSLSYDYDGKINLSSEYILGQLIQKSENLNNITSETEGGVLRDLWIEETRRYAGSSTSYFSSHRAYLIDESTGGQYRGKLYRILNEDGTAERRYVEKGDFNELTDVFTANPTGSFERVISVEGAINHHAGIANKTIRTLTVSDHKGVRNIRKEVYNGTGYELINTTSYKYNPEPGGKLTSIWKDGDETSNIAYPSATQTTETDAHGVETTNTNDTGGRLISSVKAGVAAGTGYEAQSAITTTHEEVGLSRTTTVTSGTLSLSHSSTNDLAGRIVSQTDKLGRTTTYTHANGGRIVTETAPGGVTRISTYYLDGQLKSITGTGVIAEFHAYTVDGSANIVHTVYYGTGDDTSPRWRQTVTSGLGQLLQEETPGPNGQPMVAQHTYNSKGQRIKTLRTGLADTLYVYDDLGRLIRQGTDINANGSVDLVSVDSITESDKYYEKDGSNEWWQVTVSRRYLTDNDDEDVAENITRRKLGTGAESIVEMTGPDGNKTVATSTVDRVNKTVTRTTTSDLSTFSAVQVQVNGLLVSQSSLTVSSPVLFRYDALGRQTQQIDPRTSQPRSTTVYNALGQITSVTDGEGNATTFTYYGNSLANAGLLATRTNQESETTSYAYDTLGRITHQWGNAVYPLAYAYNAYGDMTQLRTFRAAGDWANTTLPASFGSATPSVTTWGYHAGSGFQTSKTDDSSEAVSYTYHDSGLLATRTWARGVNTSYTYDTAGRLTGVNYADSTPDVTHTYRRDGQRVTSSDVAGSHVYTYHEGIGTPATETVTGGLLDGLALSWSVGGSNRPNGYSASLNAAPLNAVSYGYDATSRMNQVSSGVQSAEYAYVANSNLLHTTTFKDNTVTRLTGTRVYDDASRLGSITWSNSAAVTVSSHSYTYDGANRRLRADLADGSYWEYSYNDKGEVISGVKKNAGGAAYPGLNHGYTFDEIGNRLTATVDAEAGGNRTTSYTSNGLNQYASISHPSAFDVTGSAVDTSIVKVNTFAAQRQGKYFRKELPVSNSGQPVWANVNIEVTLPGVGVGGGDIVTTRNGHRYIAPTPESPDYDEDGNLVSDGRWVYTWDGENRLIAMETTPASTAIGVPKRKLEFTYDGGSRRIRKQVYDWNSGTSSWTLNSERRFIYDQWNLMAEVDGSGNLIKSYVWGMDLSQRMQGAGGVGGLLWSTDHTGSSGQSHFATYDGNGNVTALVEASSGDREAQYDYDAFGKTVLVEGGAVAENTVYRFSTKYEDVETGLYYYGLRYYSAELGRWLNRDPMGQRGGLNLYGMISNDPVNRRDVLGLWESASGNHWVPDSPPSPELDDQFRSGPLGNESDYWDSRFPGWVEEAKRGAKEAADAAVKAKCGEQLGVGAVITVDYSKQMTPSSDGSKGPLQDFWSHLFGTNYGENGNDGDYGDRPQDGWEANTLYGTVTFQLSTVKITGPQPEDGCCFDWEGELELIDDLGLSADDFLNHPNSASLYSALGARGGPNGADRLTRATWSVTGNICCY